MTVPEAQTALERTSDRELVVTRTVRGPARLVYEAWARPELFQRWWAPASFGLAILSFEADVRTGGGYKLVMRHPAAEQPLTFFGRYVEVVPNARIVWTNEEGEDDGPVTTVTFTDQGDQTLVTVHELYPSKAALDEALESGATSGWNEQFAQLETVLAG
jgi:uncharacterized protein YndB with AHSA1/START domain